MFLAAQTGALIEPLSGRHWDRTQIAAGIVARAGLLSAQGFKRGDRVFIHYGNSLEFFVDLMAVWTLGGCAIPIDARLTAFEIRTLAAAARPRFALIDAGLDGAIATSLSAQDVALVDLNDGTQAGAHDIAATLGLDEPALILFTSGTTGDPKGVVHTHRSLRARWMSLRDVLGTQAYRRTLCLLPTHFGHGLICNALFPWLSGNDLYILPPFRADIISTLGRLIDTHRITAMSSVPTVWNLALRLTPPPKEGSLRRIHCGSAPLPQAMWTQIQGWTGTKEVFNTYGITETASWVAGTTGDDLVPEDGLVGRPWGATIKIAKPESQTAEAAPELCAPGEAGMIWLNTPALMAGYFERDALSAQSVRAGWFMTGDIGLIDARGVLYLRGRERDEINKGGMKVYPGDVDGLALQCPGIVDACAFAVSDKLYGQDVGLAVVTGEGAPAEIISALKAFLGARLARHQQPVRYFVLNEIPRTSRGKINRDLVARTCADMTACA